jgi:hypothetical protein
MAAAGSATLACGARRGQHTGALRSWSYHGLTTRISLLRSNSNSIMPLSVLLSDDSSRIDWAPTAGANVLLGGSNKQVTLQPVSVEGSVGFASSYQSPANSRTRC